MAISIINYGNLRDKLKMSFNLFDLNKDGKLDKKEIRELLESIFELYGHDLEDIDSRNRITKILSLLDKNSN
jgi:Ca2+-binding EF-hand superfamily protein